MRNDIPVETTASSSGHGPFAPPSRRVALIGNFPPRRCGIATFTADLHAALKTADPRLVCDVVAMSDRPGYVYPPAVTAVIEQNALPDYTAAARAIADAGAGVVCVQHEYGIFGGAAGAHLLTLLANVAVPVVTTCHTVLTHPDSDQRRVMNALIERSARVVVMAEKGRRILREVYGAPDARIVNIPHGAPDRPFEETDAHKAALGFAGHTLLLTFGLLAPNKGIEAMIRAMPAIAAAHPDALYVVLGATHPHLIAHEGEAYRERLKALAEDLGVGAHVRFVDEYVDDRRLLDYLAAADLYITPYLTEAQITSGTLSYAVAMGKAVISTPYWHARELLDKGRGILTPFNDPAALSAAAIDVLSDGARRQRLREKAYAIGREMLWPQVAKRYLKVFDEVRAESVQRTREAAHARPAPHPTLAAIERMTDACGILQHSRWRVPDRAHGYCVDDNARALLLMHRMGEAGHFRARSEALAFIYAAFVQDAWNPHEGAFRNFMGYDRRWLEARGSEDSFGRTFWALGETALRASAQDLREWAVDLAATALEPASKLGAPRARAFTMLGLSALITAQPHGPWRGVLSTFARSLADRLQTHTRADWAWFERAFAYDNARLPEALIRAGTVLGQADLRDAGLNALSFLCAAQRTAAGHFRPIPTAALGKPEAIAPFDQQPLEAAAAIDACAAAYEATGAQRWLEEAECALAWFLGANDLATPVGLADGQCFDGLTPAGPNRNQGAESVLALQQALVEMQRLRGRARERQQARPVLAARA